MIHLRSMLLAMLFVASGCGGNDKSTDPASGDSVPPAAADNLTATAVADDAVRLTWGAPGDDGVAGQASRYDVRYSEVYLDGATWGQARTLAQVPRPRPSGSSESLTISPLTRGTWFFAIQAADEVPNWSPLSSVVSATVGDSIFPAAVTDLFAASIGGSTIQLDWTAPGDDGSKGQAFIYDLRYAVESIREATWEDATPVPGLLSPAPAGTREAATVEVEPGPVYYFAIRARDNGSNWSDLSNIAAVATAADDTAPAPILDLRVESATGRTVTLLWTAPGDDGSNGQATVYDLRYSESEIKEATWSSARIVSGVSSPERSGALQSAIVTGLETQTVYHFAIRTADEVSNWSMISNDVVGETGLAWRLTNSPQGAFAASPSWSPDGSRIAFRADWGENRIGLYTISAQGGDAVPILNASFEPSVFSPVWSPQGDRIAFTSRVGDSWALWVTDVGTSSVPVLLVSGESSFSRPTWSPDGSQIAYGSPGALCLYCPAHIWVVPSAGGDPKILIASGSEWGNTGPVWSADGNRMALVSTRDETWNMYVVPLSGGDWTQVTKETWFVQHTSLNWSPDGTELVFVRHFQGDRSVYRVSANGGEIEEIVVDVGGIWSLALSPRGDRIAFSSDQSGQTEIWIQNLE